MPPPLPVFETNTGYLQKAARGKKGFAKNWTKRHFVLSATSLSYFKTPKDFDPKGTVPLAGYEVRKIHDSGLKHHFKLHNMRGDELEMRGCSEMEVDDWVAALKALIAALKQQKAA